MATAVSICNTAIARIGEREFITSLNEATSHARACNVLYEASLETMLASFPWPFAKKSAVLAVVEEGEREDWAFTYALPTDCLVVRSIWPGTRTPDAMSRVPYELELNAAGNGRVLVTDDDNGEIIYTAKITSAALFPPLFADAFAWLLARELAMTVSVKPDVAVRAAQMYELSFERAMAAALNESHENEPEPESITARR